MRPDASFLGQPIRALQTMLRVIAKDNEEPNAVIPDGIYGPETVSAVSRFQREHGLPVTGVTDQGTWDAVVLAYQQSIIERSAAEPLYITLNPGTAYKRGDSAPNLYLVQAILTVFSQYSRSIGTPSLNGVLDAATEDSIASFQQLCAIPMTGQLDKNTWRHLALVYPQIAHLYSKGTSDEIVYG